MSIAEWPVADRVEESRVHGSLYVDSEVYAAEIDKIFHSSWVYVGHESEVPERGSFIRKRVADQELLLSRNSEGEVHVLFNKCPHRANMVCAEAEGVVSNFRCDYHGWAFNLDGKLTGLPVRDEYEIPPDGLADKFSMVRPFQASHQGFVFATFSSTPQPFEEFLGAKRDILDRLAGMSPTGEIMLESGSMRHLHESNWKMLMESVVDAYHPRFVHRSMYRLTEGSVGAPRLRDHGGGVVEMDFWFDYRRADEPFMWLFGIPGARMNRDTSVLAEYEGAMVQAYGAAEARQRFVDGPPHSYLFPNLFIGQMAVMVVNPVSAERCTLEIFPVTFGGGAEVNARTLRRCEGSNGPAGLITADDAEIAARSQRSAGALEPQWLELSRGTANEEIVDGVIVSESDTGETTLRGLWRQYREVMSK